MRITKRTIFRSFMIFFSFFYSRWELLGYKAKHCVWKVETFHALKNALKRKSLSPPPPQKKAPPVLGEMKAGLPPICSLAKRLLDLILAALKRPVNRQVRHRSGGWIARPPKFYYDGAIDLRAPRKVTASEKSCWTNLAVHWLKLIPLLLLRMAWIEK